MTVTSSLPARLLAWLADFLLEISNRTPRPARINLSEEKVISLDTLMSRKWVGRLDLSRLKRLTFSIEINALHPAPDFLDFEPQDNNLKGDSQLGKKTGSHFDDDYTQVATSCPTLLTFPWSLLD